MNPLSKIIVVAVLAYATNLASAQQPRQRVPLPDDLAILIEQRAIQIELHLSDAQKEAAVKLAETAIKERTDLRQLNLSPSETRKTGNELTAKNNKAVQELLQPQQFKRLNEVSLQYRLSMDLFRTLTSKLAKQLSLTEEQNSKLREIVDEQRLAYPAKMAGTRMNDIANKIRAIREEEKNDALEVLTAEQKQKFDELVGKDFDLATIDDYVKPK